MTDAHIAFVAVGALALAVGVAMMVAAIRGRPGNDPKSTILLIAGMMATAFGLLMSGFALAVGTGAEPAR